MSQKIIYRNSLRFAVFLAQAASDTSGLAYFHKGFSFIGRIAAYSSFLTVRNQLNQMFRAHIYTSAAGFA